MIIDYFGKLVLQLSSYSDPFPISFRVDCCCGDWWLCNNIHRTISKAGKPKTPIFSHETIAVSLLFNTLTSHCGAHKRHSWYYKSIRGSVSAGRENSSWTVLLCDQTKRYWQFHLICADQFRLWDHEKVKINLSLPINKLFTAPSTWPFCPLGGRGSLPNWPNSPLGYCMTLAERQVFGEKTFNVIRAE